MVVSACLMQATTGLRNFPKVENRLEAEKSIARLMQYHNRRLNRHSILDLLKRKKEIAALVGLIT